MPCATSSIRRSSLFSRAIGLASFLVFPNFAGATAPPCEGVPLDPDMHFTNVTSAVGIDHTENGSGIAEVETGGAAVSDIDNDGDLDLFVTRFDQPDILYCNQLEETGSAFFTDCTAGTNLENYALRSNGPAMADIDNDGDQDLYLSTNNQPDEQRFYLFVNQLEETGSLSFVEQALERGAAVQLVDEAGALVRNRGQSVAFGDFDRDGILDIYTTEWKRQPDRPNHVRLLRNLGSGFFEDVSVAANVAIPPPSVVAQFSVAFTDLDRDGWPDIAATGDFGTSKLFWNKGNGTFEEGTVEAGIEDTCCDMGSTIADVDGDGRLDWFMTSTPTPLVKSYFNQGNRSFALLNQDFPGGFFGWGTVAFDYDNDGDLDLTANTGYGGMGQPTHVWRNDGIDASGGVVWTEQTCELGIDNHESGKTALVFDYDEDGDQDLFVVNFATAPVLYRNDGGNSNNWIRVEVVGRPESGVNLDGLGAIVEVFVTGGAIHVREIGSRENFRGHGERVAHFGLGDLETAPAAVVATFPGLGQIVLDPDAIALNSTVRIEAVSSGGGGCGLLGIEALVVWGGALLAARRASRRRRTRVQALS